MKLPEYDDADATQMAAWVAANEVSPTELLEAAIERIEQRNPELNAVVHRMFDHARQVIESGLPDGPFRGVPFLLKDLLADDARVPTTAGSRMLAEFVPAADSELVRRYKQAGLVIVGKTNTPEFGLLGITEPALHGPSRNPWNREHTPGGSSGGSSSAVAARMVAAASAGDGGGSIRIPAACCGLVGLKPTRARTPIGPSRGEDWMGLTVQHALCRSVRDTAAFLDVEAGPEPGAPYVAPPPERPFVQELEAAPGSLRIAVFRGTLLAGRLDPECLTALDHTTRLLESLGHHVEEHEVRIDTAALARAYLMITGAATAAEIDAVTSARGRSPSRGELEPLTAFAAALGRMVSGPQLIAAERDIHVAAKAMARLHESYDVLVCATLAQPPAKIGAFAPPGWQRALMQVFPAIPARALLDPALDQMAADPQLAAYPNTQLFNMTGQPAISLPLHQSTQGLPLGVQFVARFGDEATLIRLAAQLEQAAPWKDRKPAGLS